MCNRTLSHVARLSLSRSRPEIRPFISSRLIPDNRSRRQIVPEAHLAQSQCTYKTVVARNLMGREGWWFYGQRANDSKARPTKIKIIFITQLLFVAFKWNRSKENYIFFIFNIIKDHHDSETQLFKARKFLLQWTYMRSHAHTVDLQMKGKIEWMGHCCVEF